MGSNLQPVREVLRPTTYTRGLTNNSTQTAWAGPSPSSTLPATVDASGDPSSNLVSIPVAKFLGYPATEILIFGQNADNETGDIRCYGRSVGSSIWMARFIIQVSAILSDTITGVAGNADLGSDEFVADTMTVVTSPMGDSVYRLVSPANDIWCAALVLDNQNFSYIDVEFNIGSATNLNIFWRPVQ